MFVLLLPCPAASTALQQPLQSLLHWLLEQGWLLFNNPTLGLPSAQTDQDFDAVSLSVLIWKLGKFRLDERAGKLAGPQPGSSRDRWLHI